MAHNTDADWEQFGQEDPYYGVLSHDKYRQGNLTEAALRDFFESGRQHIDFVFKTIRAHVDPAFRPDCALDFGCGVGRCLVSLSAQCRAVTGIDVSDAMLQEARQNCAKFGLANIELVKSDDQLSALTTAYDLIHSILVFQHIPPARAVGIFERLVGRLNDGGVGVIQFPYFRDVPATVRLLGALRKRVPLVNNLANLVYGKPFNEPLMEKNVYDIGRLLVILQRNRCGNVHLEFQGRGDLLNVILFFQKIKDWVAYEPFLEG